MAGSFSEEGEFDALTDLVQDAVRELCKDARRQDIRDWLKRHVDQLARGEDNVIKAS